MAYCNRFSCKPTKKIQIADMPKRAMVIRPLGNDVPCLRRYPITISTGIQIRSPGGIRLRINSNIDSPSYCPFDHCAHDGCQSCGYKRECYLIDNLCKLAYSPRIWQFRCFSVLGSTFPSALSEEHIDCFMILEHFCLHLFHVIPS